MKKSLLLSIIFSAITLISIAQTKPATTTTKKTTTTTTTKKTTTPVKKTVAKPAAKTTVAKPAAAKTVAPAAVTPVEAPKEVVAPPVEVVKEPAGPPVTGPLGDGPKSYSAEPTPKGKTIGNTTKTTKTVVAKPEKVRKNNISDDGVRSYIGIRGGYNLSSVDGLEDEIGTGTLKNLAGYMGGIVLNIGVSKSFSIQPEVLYSQQGVEASEGSDYIRGKLNIVNVPLLLKLAFGSPKIKFFINAGPYIGYKLSQSTEMSVGGVSSSENVDFVTEYDAQGQKDNRFDFGGIGGAGLQFNLGGPILTLEGRYQYGMADPILFKDGKPSDFPKGYGQHRVMTGTLGLLFPLGGK